MSARFEIVRTDAPQPWHARFVAANGKTVWTTENYARVGRAEGAVLAIAFGLGFTRGMELAWNVEGIEKVFVYPNQPFSVHQLLPDMPLVKYVDERKAGA